MIKQLVELFSYHWHGFSESMDLVTLMFSMNYTFRAYGRAMASQAEITHVFIWMHFTRNWGSCLLTNASELRGGGSRKSMVGACSLVHVVATCVWCLALHIKALFVIIKLRHLNSTLSWWRSLEFNAWCWSLVLVQAMSCIFILLLAPLLLNQHLSRFHWFKRVTLSGLWFNFIIVLLFFHRKQLCGTSRIQYCSNPADFTNYCLERILISLALQLRSLHILSL